MTLEEKASKLAEFLDKEGILRTCIGLAYMSHARAKGEDSIDKLYVYLEKKHFTSKKIPKVFMDTPIIVQVIGKIRPL